MLEGFALKHQLKFYDIFILELNLVHDDASFYTKKKSLTKENGAFGGHAWLCEGFLHKNRISFLSSSVCLLFISPPEVLILFVTWKSSLW